MDDETLRDLRRPTGVPVMARGGAGESHDAAHAIHHPAAPRSFGDRKPMGGPRPQVGRLPGSVRSTGGRAPAGGRPTQPAIAQQPFIETADGFLRHAFGSGVRLRFYLVHSFAGVE